MLGRCRVSDRDTLVVEGVTPLSSWHIGPRGIAIWSGLVDVDDVAEEINERDASRRRDGERGGLDLWRVDVIGGDVICYRVYDGGEVGGSASPTAWPPGWIPLQAVVVPGVVVATVVMGAATRAQEVSASINIARP